MRKILLISSMLTALSAWGQIQYPYILLAPSDPTGQGCGQAPQLQTLYSSGAIYSCDNGTWAIVGGGVATSVPFSGVTAATNANALVIGSGGSLSPTGTGSISANVSPIPSSLQYYGDGSEGALNVTSGTTNITPGEHWFTTCNVSAGATLAVVASTTLVSTAIIIRCTGSMTLAGTISYSFNTGSSSGVSGIGNFTGGGGGGGFGAANGAAGAGGFLGALGAGTAGTTGVSGGNGTVAPAQVQKMLISGLYSPVSGLQCGGSSGGLGGSAGGAGGRGGGCVIIVAPSFSFTGTCDVSGVNGGAGGSNTGGGGGGSGGACIFRSPSMTNSGTFTLAGGNAGAIGTGTSTAGGSGQAGFSKVFTQ